MDIDMIDLYKKNYTKIYNYALRLSAHPQDAQDITQETFLSAMTKMDTVRDKEAIVSWLMTICYHKFIDQTRQGKYKKEVEDIDQLEMEGKLLDVKYPQPEIEVLVAEEIKNLQNGCFLAMVRRLTLNQRIIFSLVDMYGMNIEEAADMLRVSIGAAKGLLYRARMNIDAFFFGHCNLLNIENPCSCKAWIEFSSNRNHLQIETKQLVETLDYKKEGYKFDDVVRSKIYYLYKNMPDKQPPEEWYENVLQILKENQKKT